MKLRLPHKFQAALLAAIASVSFTTLSTGTLGAAFFVSGQAFAEDAEEEPSATIDIGDTNLDAQAAMEEEEGTAEKEPGSAPINEAGFNGGPGNNAGLLITESVDIDETALVAVAGSGQQDTVSGSADSTPSDNLGFTSTPYATGSDTSNGSDDFSLTGTAPAAAYVPGQSGISAEEGDSAAGTGSGSSSNKTTTGGIGSIGGTGSGATGGSVARPMALTAPNMLSPVSSLSVGGTSLGGVSSSLPESTMLGAAGAANDQTLHVYILTGQSNSLGAVKSTPLSQSKLDAYFTDGTMLWNANLTKGGACFVDPDQQAWQDVVPQLPSYSTQAGEPSNLCMGPEYGFVHMLTRLSAEEKAPAVDAEHLAIIKFSLDGGGSNYWNKSGSPTSYGTMLAAAERAVLAAQAEGYSSISLDGLMYLQGESNSNAQAGTADVDYQTFVTNLSTDLKAWMQQESITGVTVSFDTNSVLGEPMLGTTDRQTTNNKFIALAGGNADKNGYGYVYTDDLGHIGDKLHFTGEAQLTIGARYAYAFAVQNNYDVGAVRGANKSAALDTAGAWWMEAMPSSTDVVKWDVSSCSTVNTISSSLTVGGILVEDPYNNAVFITGGSLDIGASGIEVQKGALNVSSAVNVASSQSWRSQNGFAINTTGNVIIASDATLTIQDGAVVNFHSIAGAGNLTLGTGSGLVSLGMSAQDFAAATPVGEAHYTEGDNGFFNGSRSIITVSGNLVIAEGTTLGGMDGLTGAIFSVSDDHHSLYAAATSQTDYFVRSGKITYAAGTNAYAATGLILVDKGSGDACLSLETNLKDNVSIQVSGTGNAIEIAEGVNLAAASLQIGDSGNVALKGNGFYTSNSVSHTGITLDPSNWHGVYMLKGVTIGTGDTIKNCTVGDSYVGLCGVSGVDSKWNGTQEANIWLQDNGDTVAWTWNNGNSQNFSTETFTGKIAGDGTLKKTTAKYKQNYTFEGDISDWTGTLWIADQNSAGTMTYQSAATVINSEIKNTSAQGITLVLGDTLDGTNAYTLNNSANVATLSADGRTLNLGTNEKADGTKTVGNLTVSGNTTLDTLTLGSGTTATFGGTTNLAGVNGTGGTLVVGGGNLNVSGSVGGTVAINLQSGSVGNISIASGSNVTLSQAGGTYGIVSVAADTTLTLGSALNVADMTFGSGAKLDATVDFMRNVTYSGTSTGYRDNSDTVNGYQQYSDASFTLVTKSAGTAGTVQGAGLLESWTLVSTADSVVAHGGTVKAGKYYVNTSVDYDAASSTSTAYTGASEMVLNSANATLNLLSNLNANACSGGITTAGGATAIASTINIGSGVTLNANQIIRKGSDTVTLAGSGTFAVAGINSTGKKFNAYDALPAGVSKGTSWFGCLSLNGNIEQLWLNQAPGGSTVRLDGVTGFMGGSSGDNEQIVAEVEIGAGGYTFTNANTGTRNFKGGFSGTGNLVHANQGLANSPNLVFSSNMENFTGSIINQKASAGFTLNFNTGASVVNAASIKNDGTAANMLITMNVNDATTFNTLIDKGQGNINLTVASGKSATFNGNTSVSSLSASGADVALGSGASLAVAGATTVSNLSLAGGNTVAFGNGLTYDTLSAEGVSSMSLSGAVSMGEYLMLGKGTLSVNNVQLDLSRDAWDAALDREGSQYSDGESTVNGYATGMKLILARASRIDGAGYAAASGGSLAGMNLSIEVYGAEEDPECSVGGYAQHLVAMGADTSHTYFVNTEAEYDSSSETSGASTRLVMNRANASLSLASNLDSSVCVGGIVVEAQGTSVIVKSGVDLSAGDIHYGDTLTSICVEDQGTLVLEGFGGSAIALDRLTLEDGSALDLAALTTFAPAQKPVLLQGMGGGSGMMKVNSNAIGDFSGISLLGDAAPDSPQTVVLATAANGIELGSNVDLKNLVIPEQYQAKLSTQAAEGGGYNLVLTLGAASNDLVWDNDSSNGLWDSGDNWHAASTPTTHVAFSEGDNVQFSSGFANTVALNGDVNAGTMTIDNGVEVTVNTDGHNLSVTDLDSTSGTLIKTGAGTATFRGSDGVTLTKLTVSGGTAVFDEHVTISGNDWITVSNSGTEIQLLDGMTFNGTGGGNSYALIVGASDAKAVFGGTTDMSTKNIGGAQGSTIELEENANVTVLGVVNSRQTFSNNQNVVLGAGSSLTAGEFRTQTLTLGNNTNLNLTGSSNRDSEIATVSGSGDINVLAKNLKLNGSSNYTGNVTLSNAANLEINATNFGGKIANTGTGTVTMYGRAEQLANQDARIEVTKKSGQQLFLAAGSEKAISKVTVAAGDGQWLLAEGIGENTDGLYTDIHLGGKGLILSQPNTTVNIGSLSGVSGTTVQGDYNSGGGRVLAVHQDEDAEYAGIFTSGTDSRSVGLNKYGSSTLTLTGANTSTNALNIYEGAIKLDGADAKWSGAATVYSGGTLELTSSVATLVSNVTINSGGTLTLGNYKDDAVTATNLTLASDSILDLSNLSFTGDEAGEITLIAGGTITATDPGSVILNFADSSLKDRATLSKSGTNLVLTFTPINNSLIWNGGTNTWDVDNTAYWHTEDAPGISIPFSQDSDVKFESGNSTANLAADISAGTMTLDSGANVTINGSGYSLSAAGINGDGSTLTIANNAVDKETRISGEAELDALNVKGGTTVFAGGSADLGRITMQNGNGDTTLQFSAKEDTDNEYVFETLDMAPNGGPVRKLIVDEGVKVTGTGSNLGTGQNSSISSGWGVNGGGLLINGELDVAGVISFDDNNTSIINGSGTIKTAGLNISNGNTTTVSGGVTIDITSSTGIYSRTGNGTLKLADATLKAVDVDWTLSLTANLTDSNTGTTFDVAVDRTITVSSSLGGSGNLVKTGDGTLTLSGNNSFSGNVTVGAGTLQLGQQNALGSSNASGTKKITINEGGTIDINGKDNTIYKYTLSGGSLVNNGSDTVFNHTQNAGIELTADSSVGGTGKMWMIASSWGETTADLGGRTLTKKDSGTFSFVNTHISKGTIQIDDGTVEFYADKTHSQLSGDIKLNGGTFTGAVQMVEDNNITASQTSSANGKIELTTNHTTTLSAADGVTMTLSGVISGAGAVAKSDAGTVTLSGANTYTGGTTINAGTVATANTSALGLSTVTIADGATLQVNGELNIGGSGANSYGVLDNSAGGTIDLTNGSFLKLHAGSADRTYNLGNVDVSGSASISEEWFDATVNIANINGGAGGTLALISNHSNASGTWNIGTSTGKAQNFTGTLVLQDQDTLGYNSRTVNFNFKDGNMLSGATIETQTGELKPGTDPKTMTNNINLGVSEVKFGGINDGTDHSTATTRTVVWNIAKSDSVDAAILNLDGAGTYRTTASVRSGVSINKTGTGSQSFTGDLSAMNNGTVTATAGTLTLDNSSSTKGTLYSVTVNGGTLALDNMNVTDAVTLSSGTLDLMSATNVGSLNMTGGTLAMDGTNRLSSSTGNLAFTSGMLDLSGMTVEAGHDYILATTTSGSLTLGADVDFTLSNPSLKDQFTLQKQGKSLVLTFVTTEDLIWSGGNGNWSSNHWHTETAPDTPVSFTDDHNVTFESGEAEVTLTQNVTAPTTTLKSGAVVKVVSEQGGNYTLDTTLKGAGTFVLADSQMALPSGVSLSSSDWHGVVRISGSQPTNGWNLATLDNIASTIEFAGVSTYFSDPGNDLATPSKLTRDVIFTNAGEKDAAVYFNNGYSRDGAYEFSGNVSGNGTFHLDGSPTYHLIFSGNIKAWDGEIKVTNCGSGNDGSWVKFTGSATEVNAAINQTGGTFRVIADANTTFKDNINVQRLEVTTDHTATLEGDVTLTGAQGKGITGSGAVNVAQGGTLTFASGVDTISGTLTVSDGATLKLSEMNDAAITTSGTLTLNGGSTLDLSILTGITGHELTPITLVKGGTITDTDLGGVKLVFAGDVTGGKLSVQNNALVLTFIEPGKTLIWDNNSGNQTWSNQATHTNWHTPNNPHTHIGFEEYDMVQFTGTGSTSVHLGEDVTPARMDVASGKTLTVYTEGNDLTILQDLDARGASVVLNSDNKEEQATRIMGNTTLKNLTLDDGTASLGGHTEVSEKLTVKNDAEVTVSGTMATKALDISGGSSVSLAAGGTALTTKVAGDSTLTVGANSSLGQLTLDSGTVTNNATLTLSNTQDTMVSGDSRITGTGTTITTGIRLEDNSTLTIDGGQTVSITTDHGIIGGTGNGSVLTLGNVTMTGTASWSVADTVDTVNLTSTTGSGTVFDTNAHSVTVNAGMSGDGNLTKVGHGTLTLNGSNSFSGNTTVSAGTLKVNKADGLTSSANVSVADGATLWFNSSTPANVSGNTVIADGGTLHLGSENALTTTTGTLTLNGSSVLNLSGLEIKQNQLEYVLASGKSITLVSGFDMDDVIVEYGTHPETGSTPSIIVRPNTETGLEELVLTYDVINSNSLYWNGGTADWTGSGTWHDVTTKDSTTFAEFDDVFFAPTEYSESAAASVQANVTQNTNVHDMHIVAREGEGAAKNTVYVEVNSGKTLTVDFLNADVNTAFIKQGAGTAIVGIKDPHFGADVSVTAGILTTQFLDLAGNGMVVDGELNRTGGTLNLEVGRAETPTNVEFRQSVSGVKNFTVNEGSNATFTGQVTVPNGQDIYMDVASDASVTFAHDVSLASNSWVIQGDGTVNFDGPTVISEVSGHFNQLNGNAKVNFNSTLSTAAKEMDIRLDPGTNLYIKELDMVNSNQDTLYFTFKNTYGTQVDRDSVQIDKMVVDGSRGIGTNLSSLSGLEDYQAGGDINIKQLVNAAGGTSDDIARLCNYVSHYQAKATLNGWGIAQVFNLGEATQEGAAFEGIIRLQDSRTNENWYGTEDAHKKTVLVLNDEYVASEAVIELKNYSNFSDFAIGINTANAKVTAIEDYEGHAMQNGNYAKVFSGAMDSANTAVPQSDDTLRTLELIGTKDDDANTVHSTSAGVDRNLNIVKDGAGTQVFSGDSSKFNGSIEVKEGVLEFSNTASLHIEDLTLGKDKVQQPALMKSAPLKAGSDAANVDTLAVRTDAAGENVGMAEVNGTLKAKSGAALDSNLTLASGSKLDVHDTLTTQPGEFADKTDYVGGLDMLGNSLTLQSGAYLSNADRSALLSMQWGERYELAYGVSSLTLGDSPSTTEAIVFHPENYKENNIEASQFFQNLQEEDYYICYSGATGKGPGGNVGTLYIFKAPEPTTSTLSLLALAALAARRRRK